MKLNFIVSRPIDQVIGHLTDMDKFVMVHPLIYKVIKTDDDKYIVFEKVKMALATMKFNYPIEVTKSNDCSKIEYKATVLGLVHIQFFFLLSAIENGKTEVVEVVNIKSYLPVKTYMEKLISDQHAILFNNISTKI